MVFGASESRCAFEGKAINSLLLLSGEVAGARFLVKLLCLISFFLVVSALKSRLNKMTSSPSRTANIIPSGDKVIFLQLLVFFSDVVIAVVVVEVDAVSAKRKEINGNENRVHLDMALVLIWSVLPLLVVKADYIAVFKLQLCLV